MDINQVEIKNGWIFALRELAKTLPDQAGIQALTPVATPASATAEACANKINEIIAALKDVA